MAGACGGLKQRQRFTTGVENRYDFGAASTLNFRPCQADDKDNNTTSSKVSIDDQKKSPHSRSRVGDETRYFTLGML